MTTLTVVTAEDLIEALELEPHPLEGGFFRETYRAAEHAPGQDRSLATAIYYLLTPQNCSTMHRLPTDEIWHFYRGDPLTLLLLHDDGTSRTAVLGPDVLGGQHVQFVVPAGTWMAAAVAEGGSWSLFGCTMAPGFSYEDYEHGDAAELAERFPQEAALIAELSRP